MSRDKMPTLSEDYLRSLNDHQLRKLFLDYRAFMHNFQDEIGTTKHYLPHY